MTWDTNKRVLRFAKIAKFVAAFAVVTSLADLHGAESKADECIAKAVYYREVVLAGANDSIVWPAKLELHDALKSLMGSFSQNPIDQLPANLGLFWWLINDDEAAIFDRDPEYDSP